MTIYEFKRHYQTANPEGHFFDRSTLRHYRVYRHGTGWCVVRVTGRHHEWLFDANFKQIH
jgi:hypothetical protein